MNGIIFLFGLILIAAIVALAWIAWSKGFKAWSDLKRWLATFFNVGAPASTTPSSGMFQSFLLAIGASTDGRTDQEKNNDFLEKKKKEAIKEAQKKSPILERGDFERDLDEIRLALTSKQLGQVGRALSRQEELDNLQRIASGETSIF